MSDVPPNTSDRPAGKRNLWFALAVLAAFALVYAYVNRPVKMPAGWGEDFAAARERARREGLPLFVDFGASWCPPCREMVRSVLPAPEVVRALEGFILVKVDVDEHRDLAASFRAEALPTFLVLTPAGREVYRIEGYRSVEAFVAEIARAREQLGSR